jgi:hypothetical protein
MRARIVNVVFFATVTFLFSSHAQGQPGTKKMRSRDLLILERQRAQEASVTYERETAKRDSQAAALREEIDGLKKSGLPGDEMKKQVQLELEHRYKSEIEALKGQLETVERHKSEIEALKARLDLAEKQKREMDVLKMRLAKSEGEAARLRELTEEARARRWFGAIVSGDVDNLKKMTAEGDARAESVSAFHDLCPAGLTSLMCAVRAGQIRAVEWLLTQRINVNRYSVSNYIDYNGWTALLLATLNNRLKIADLLLDAGADIHQARGSAGGETGITPIASAAEHASAEMIEFLFAKGAVLEHLEDWSLMGLARFGNKPGNFIKLLELGAPLPTACLAEARTFVEAAKNPYFLDLWNTAMAGKGKWFLAKREHEIFLAIKSEFDAPDPITHLIFSYAWGTPSYVKPKNKTSEIIHGLEVLKMSN